MISFSPKMLHKFIECQKNFQGDISNLQPDCTSWWSNSPDNPVIRPFNHHTYEQYLIGTSNLINAFCLNKGVNSILSGYINSNGISKWINISVIFLIHISAWWSKLIRIFSLGKHFCQNSQGNTEHCIHIRWLPSEDDYDGNSIHSCNSFHILQIHLCAVGVSCLKIWTKLPISGGSLLLKDRNSGQNKTSVSQ